MTNIDETYIEGASKEDSGVLIDILNVKAFSWQELINNEIMVLIAHVQKLENQIAVIGRTVNSSNKQPNKKKEVKQ